MTRFYLPSTAGAVLLLGVLGAAQYATATTVVLGEPASSPVTQETSSYYPFTGEKKHSDDPPGANSASQQVYSASAFPMLRRIDQVRIPSLTMGLLDPRTSYLVRLAFSSTLPGALALDFEAGSGKKGPGAPASWDGHTLYSGLLPAASGGQLVLEDPDWSSNVILEVRPIIGSDKLAVETAWYSYSGDEVFRDVPGWGSGGGTGDGNTPEPGTLLLLACGLGVIGVRQYRRRAADQR
jgi:hypothetical protein